MEPVIRYRSLTYLGTALLLAWVCIRTLAMVFGWVSPRADRVFFGDVSVSTLLGVAIAGATTVALWKNEKAHTWITEVIVELTKVTWPEIPETRRSTYVVIGFAAGVSVVLAAFDFFWKFATDLIL